MALNDLPCGRCRNYDPILGSNEKETQRGWCIPRSKYPHKEGPGQVFPEGVARVGPKELAQPYIVRKNFVHGMCEFARPTDVNLVEEKQNKQVKATTRKDGRRAHT